MLVIFDCDGVLIDSEAVFCSVDAEALTRMGHPTTASVIAERFCGISHQTSWGQLATELSLNLPDNWVESILQECDRRFETELRPIDGAVDAVSILRQRGYETCVASSTELNSLRRNIDRVNMLECLDPNKFSASQVKRSKPAPDIFLFAASQMGFDPCEVIVIEDSVAGVTTAKRAGMMTFGFVGGGHAYDALPARLSEAGAERVCFSMAEVVEFVEEIRIGIRSMT